MTTSWGPGPGVTARGREEGRWRQIEGHPELSHIILTSAQQLPPLLLLIQHAGREAIWLKTLLPATSDRL